MSKSNSKTPPPFVAWFSGTTGTGKSYTCEQIAKRLGFEVYKANLYNNEYFSIYDHEQMCIWDHYSNELEFDKLLKFIDRNGFVMNNQIESVFFKPLIIIFISIEGHSNASALENDNGKMQLARRIHYTCEFESNAYNAIPSLEEIKNISNEVTDEFLGVFKQHLISTGFQNIADVLPCMKDVIPLEVDRLVMPDARIKLSCKMNLLEEGEDEGECSTLFKPIYTPPSL